MKKSALSSRISRTFHISRMIETACLLTLLLVIPGLLAAQHRPSVKLADADWHCRFSQGAREHDAAGLRRAFTAWLEAWVRRDLKSCRERLAEDALIVSQNQAALLAGKEAILAGLKNEWNYFETDDRGASALECTIRHARVEIKRNAAMISYYLDVSGGNRWDFDDTAGFVQIFIRSDAESDWKYAFGADVWSLSFDTDSEEAGSPGFTYDYAQPVHDLGRAISFYKPLLGEPEAVTPELAVFELRGSRLYLVASESAPLAPLRPGLPNGWPIVFPPDFAQARTDAEEAGVVFNGGETAFAGFKVLTGFEPSGNLVALARHDQAGLPGRAAELASEPQLIGTAPSDLVLNADRSLLSAWLQGDVTTFAGLCDGNVAVLDAARSQTRGWARGTKALADQLRKDYARPARASGWRKSSSPEPESVSHDFVTLRHSEGQVRHFGPWQIIARRGMTIGAEPWKRRAEFLDARVFDSGSGKLVAALSAPAARPQGLAMEFDYLGIPVASDNWEDSDLALAALTGDADSYTDDGWKGFWGELAVLGMFEASPADDRMPRDNEASAYLSLLVSSVNKAVDFARQSGATFPRVPAINGVRRIERLPGYNQVYFTDSEGNGIVLTEYTGRSGR